MAFLKQKAVVVSKKTLPMKHFNFFSAVAMHLTNACCWSFLLIFESMTISSKFMVSSFRVYHENLLEKNISFSRIKPLGCKIMNGEIE